MKRSTRVVLTVSAIALGAAVGYAIVRDVVLSDRVKQNLKDVFNISKKKVDEVSEEVAVRTAKLTRNPKVNQDWVSKQWESIGY